MKVIGVSTLISSVVDFFCEAVIQVEKVRPIVDVRDDDSLLLNRGVTKNRVIDPNTGEIVVFLVICFDKGIGDIGDCSLG